MLRNEALLQNAGSYIERKRGVKKRDNLLLSPHRNIDVAHFDIEVYSSAVLENAQLNSDSARMLEDLWCGGIYPYLGLRPLLDERFTGAMTPLITSGR